MTEIPEIPGSEFGYIVRGGGEFILLLSRGSIMCWAFLFNKRLPLAKEREVTSLKTEQTQMWRSGPLPILFVAVFLQTGDRPTHHSWV